MTVRAVASSIVRKSCHGKRSADEMEPLSLKNGFAVRTRDEIASLGAALRLILQLGAGTARDDRTCNTG